MRGRVAFPKPGAPVQFLCSEGMDGILLEAFVLADRADRAFEAEALALATVVVL